MNLVTKIACRTMGIAGMGIAMYDAVQVAKLHSKNEGLIQEQKHVEDVYYSSRTIDNVSYANNDFRDTAFNLRSKNPIPKLYGNVKGAVKGFVYGLGNFLPMIVCASAALLSKNIMAKIGAAGVTVSLLYNIARNGFGVGKNNPVK